MEIDHIVLGQHIQDDPNGRGYAVHVASGTTNVIAALLNEVLLSITIQRETVTAPEVWEAVNLAEFKALSIQERQALDILLGMETLNVSPGSNSRATLAALFPAGPTRDNLIALVRRNGSEVEELFGENIRATSKDVALALGGP